jgi:hypothetical protein
VLSTESGYIAESKASEAAFSAAFEVDAQIIAAEPKSLNDLALQVQILASDIEASEVADNITEFATRIAASARRLSQINDFYGNKVRQGDAEAEDVATDAEQGLEAMWSARKRLIAKGTPMIPEADIYRSAQVMIHEHGKTALELSQARANKFWNAGDDEGAAVWMRIARAIEELRRAAPGKGEQQH